MPTYQYACTQCEHGFEAVQSFTDDALAECPQCQGRLRKVFGAVGIVFKGSGFYRTDSRDKAGAKGTAGEAAKADGSGKADGAGAKDPSGQGEATKKAGSTGGKADSAATSKTPAASGTSTSTSGSAA